MFASLSHWQLLCKIWEKRRGQQGGRGPKHDGQSSPKLAKAGGTRGQKAEKKLERKREESEGSR